MDENLGKEIENKMQEILNKTLIVFYKSYDEELFQNIGEDKETKQLLIAALLNIIVQISGHIFYQIPQMFPGMPIFFDVYSNEVMKAMKQSFEKIAIFYQKHQKKEELIEFIKGEKELNAEEIKTYKELH